MNRPLVASGGFLLLFVVLTQVGWLSNGFFGFQVGGVPSGARNAILTGLGVALLTLLILKIVRWWKK